MYTPAHSQKKRKQITCFFNKKNNYDLVELESQKNFKDLR